MIAKPSTIAVSVMACTSGSETGSPRSSGAIGARPRLRPDAISVRLAALAISVMPMTTRKRSVLRIRNAPLPNSTATAIEMSRITPAPPRSSVSDGDHHAEHQQEHPDVEDHGGDQLERADVDDVAPGAGRWVSRASPRSSGHVATASTMARPASATRAA